MMIFKKKAYIYHVVYGTTKGVGSITYYTGRPIDEELLEKIAKGIKEKIGTDVAITNFVFLGRKHFPPAQNEKVADD